MRLTLEQQTLVEKNHNLIYAMLHKYKLPIDDYYGIAAIGLCNAALAYDPTKGKFSTFACRVMINELFGEIRRENAKKRGKRKTISMDSDNGERLVGNIPSYDDLEERAMCLDALAEVAKLPPKQREVVAMLIEGYTYQEISERTGYSCTAVGTIFSDLGEIFAKCV